MPCHGQPAVTVFALLNVQVRQRFYDVCHVIDRDTHRPSQSRVHGVDFNPAASAMDCRVGAEDRPSPTKGWGQGTEGVIRAGRIPQLEPAELVRHVH